MLIHKYTVHLSRGPEVGGRKRDRRKEGGLMKRRHFIYFYDKMAWFLYRSFKLLILGFYFYFYSLKFCRWRTGIDGHPGERKGLLLRQSYKVQIQVNTPSYCTMIGLLHKLVRIQGDQGTYHKRDPLKYSFYTWAKIKKHIQGLLRIMAATVPYCIDTKAHSRGERFRKDNALIKIKFKSK